ncbi:interaptin [Heterostelium album PN500]|uniref:Interaptin n=1 Tax=Heterostelium pallidum (strain ATCC 26659 / Pp 5 / PN500) TaxID=670386 RepID=D3B849_HETP5|nr:interaptin [Heterostelium album PN500]EFA82217.1 interaptin [Heterostelium album PN500]|eukprot:XP_020434334.1 interaptin [Heterostelium album PN500]
MESWIVAQKKVFTNWCNIYLGLRQLSIKEIDKEFKDGLLLAHLLEILSGKNVLVSKCSKLKNRVHLINNINFSLKFISDEGIKLVGCGAEDITDENLKLIMGLIWTLIKTYQIQTIQQNTTANANLNSSTNSVGSPYKSKQTANEALLNWTRQELKDYSNIHITDFTNSFKDGIVFCSLVHKLIPEAIDISSLQADQAMSNLQLAFDTAKKELNIPAILEAKDIIESPDELCIMTYLSLFPKVYQKFNDPNIANKRFSVSWLTPSAPINMSGSNSSGNLLSNGGGSSGNLMNPISQSDSSSSSSLIQDSVNSSSFTNDTLSESSGSERSDLEDSKSDHSSSSGGHEKDDKVDKENAEKLNKLSEELDSLKKIIGDLEKQLVDKQHNIETIEDQSKKTTNHLQILLNGYSDQNELVELIQHIESGSPNYSLISSLSKLMLERTDKIKSLQSEIESINQDLTKNKSSYDDVSKELDELRQFKNQCQCTTLVVVLQQKIKDLESDFQSKESAHHEALGTVEKDLEQAQQKIEQLNGCIEEEREKSLVSLDQLRESHRNANNDLQLEIEKKTNEISEKDERIKVLQSDIESVTNNLNEQSSKSIKQLEDSNQALIEERKALLAEKQMLESEKEERSKVHQSDIESVTKNLNEQMDSNQALIEEKKALLAEKQMLESEKEVLQSDIEILKKDRDEQISQAKEQSSKSIKELEDSNQALIEEKKALLVEKEVLDSEKEETIRVLQSNIDSLTKNLNDQVNQSKEQSSLEDSNQTLLEENRALRAVKQMMDKDTEEKVRELNDQINQTKEQSSKSIKQLEDSNQALEEQNKTLLAKKQELDHEKQELVNEKSKLDNSVKQLSEEVDRLNREKLSIEEKANDSLNSQVESTTKKLSEERLIFIDQLESLKVEKDQVISSYQLQINDLNKHVESKENDLKELKESWDNEKQSFLEEINRLKEEVESLDTISSEKSRVIETINQEKQQLVSGQNDNHQQQVNEKDDQIIKLLEDIKRLEESLLSNNKAKDSTIEKLTKDNEEKSQAFEERDGYSKSLESQLIESNEKIRTLTENTATLEQKSKDLEMVKSDLEKMREASVESEQSLANTKKLYVELQAGSKTQLDRKNNVIQEYEFREKQMTEKHRARESDLTQQLKERNECFDEKLNDCNTLLEKRNQLEDTVDEQDKIIKDLKKVVSHLEEQLEKSLGSLKRENTKYQETFEDGIKNFANIADKMTLVTKRFEESEEMVSQTHSAREKELETALRNIVSLKQMLDDERAKTSKLEESYQSLQSNSIPKQQHDSEMQQQKKSMSDIHSNQINKLKQEYQEQNKKQLQQQQQQQQQQSSSSDTTDPLDESITNEVRNHPYSQLQKVYKLANKQYFVNSNIVNIISKDKKLYAKFDEKKIVLLQELFITPTSKESKLPWGLIIGGIVLAIGILRYLPITRTAFS